MTGFASSFHILRNRHEIVRYLVCSVWRIYYCQLAAAGLQKLFISPVKDLSNSKSLLKFLLSYWAKSLQQSLLFSQKMCCWRFREKYRGVQKCDERYSTIFKNWVVLEEEQQNSMWCFCTTAQSSHVRKGRLVSFAVVCMYLFFQYTTG